MIFLADFSKTFTASDMPTTWSVFAKSGMLGDEYIGERQKLFDIYHAREQAGDILATEAWFQKHMELLVKYGLTTKQIDALVLDDSYFAPRIGVDIFLREIISRDIPLTIVSSGISYIIMRWFQLRFEYTPEVILANELIFENGIAKNMDIESIVTPLDKLITIESESNEEVLILGDNIEDMKIIQNPTRTIGFTDEERGFDVNLGREGSMDQVLEYLL